LTDFTQGPEAEDLNPIQVEKRIQELVRTLSDSLVEWKRRYGEWKDAEREFDKAYAIARIGVDKEVAYNDRKYHADVATMEQREVKEVAEGAFKYSEARLAGVRSALSAWQSIGRSVNEAYRNVGRVE
jgi:hypothetical protein